jgi:hypothetical protein
LLLENQEKLLYETNEMLERNLVQRFLLVQNTNQPSKLLAKDLVEFLDDTI